MRHILYVGILFALLGISSIPNPTHAQIPCGSIIAPEYWADSKSTLIATPIADCADPFLVTKDMTSPYRLSINGNPVSEEGVVEFDETGLHSYSIFGFPTLTSVNHLLFLHDGNDYRFVDMNPSEPQEFDYQTLAEAFFPQGTDVSPYVRASIDGDYYFNLDPDMQNMFWEFSDYVDQHFVPKIPQLAPGTYTLVSKEYLLVVTQESFLQKLFAYVFPTAHAQSFPEYVYTLTFTITQLQQEGISNILFLPGIQASRLYTEGMLGTEDQVWPPSANFGQDLHDIAMTSDGYSENVVYTRDVIDSTTGVGNIYAGLINFLEGLKTASVPMKEYTAFAYDWRYDVFDIIESGVPYEGELKSLVDEVSRLSNSSHTGKVTVVAHSNGGLVAKALLTELESRGIKNKIDRVIFLGVPQLGTPKAIGTILHGYDQTDALGGIVTNAHTAREVINNMPGAYGLLPSEKYLMQNTGSLISFDDSLTTASYRLSYGSTIDTFIEYKRFLLGEENLTSRTLEGSIALPAKANSTLLETAFDNHQDKLDFWVAPDGVEIVEIVGTGLPTMRGVEYRSIAEGEDCVSINGSQTCTPRQILKPYAQLTKYGDQTVIQSSAGAYEKDKGKYFVNLKLLNESTESEYKHFNLTEVPQIQDLISKVMTATSTDGINYISTNQTSFNDEYDVEIIDSPVRLLAEDVEGNQSGVKVVDGVEKIFEDIPGSQYFEFGDTKYLVVPKNTEHKTTLFGETDGHYGLTIARLGSGDTQVIEHQFQNATVTPQMVATYTKNGDVYSDVATDMNGDGIIDVETDIDGEVIVAEVTYAVLKDEIRKLNLHRIHEKVLLILVNQAEHLSKHVLKKHKKSERVEEKILVLVKKQLERYKKMKLITNEQYRKIEEIIIVLIKK